MSRSGPVLTDLMLKYPFVHYSRSFFDSIPIDESFSSEEVLPQAEERLMDALGRGNYHTHMTEQVEFSSFFVAAFVAGQDGFLTSKFARKEAERSREFFKEEKPEDKTAVIRECFGLKIQCEKDEDSRYGYSVSFEDYLSLMSKYELGKLQKWKLVRQPLSAGRVYLTENVLNDLFADSAQRVISDGLKNLRRAPFPKQLLELKSKVTVYAPAPRVRPGRGYNYIEELLKHPVADGRHRLVWLVLAPFLVNVKKLDEEEAIEKIRAYVSATGEMRAMKRFVEYNVRRAKRNGLMPPTISKVKQEHPDLYSLLPKEVTAPERPETNSKTSTK